MKTAKIRLYVEQPLGEGQTVPLTRDQAHYLFGVMRQGVGDAVLVFNGRDGEWRGEVTEAGKRAGTLAVQAQTASQRNPPDLWLIFAPIKKARTDFIVEKATEMGAARILPVQTDFTNAERVRRDRLQAHAVEAAEQCGGTFVPRVCDLQKLGALLDAWPEDRRLMFCDEALAGGIAAAHMNVPVAHVHGGDAMDGAIIDDSIRHAITKFAHLHFPASERSAERIRRLGEASWRVRTVGAPGLDDVGGPGPDDTLLYVRLTDSDIEVVSAKG